MAPWYKKWELCQRLTLLFALAGKGGKKKSLHLFPVDQVGAPGGGVRRAACGVRQLAQAQHLPCLVCCGWELAQLEGTLSGSWHRQPCVSPDLRVLLSCCPAASCLPRSASFSRWATAPRWTPRAATPAATHLRCAFFRLSSALLCCALDAPETLPSCARRACICWRARFRGCTSFLGLPGHARPAS